MQAQNQSFAFCCILFLLLTLTSTKALAIDQRDAYLEPDGTLLLSGVPIGDSWEYEFPPLPIDEPRGPIRNYQFVFSIPHPAFHITNKGCTRYPDWHGSPHYLCESTFTYSPTTTERVCVELTETLEHKSWSEGEYRQYSRVLKVCGVAVNPEKVLNLTAVDISIPSATPTADGLTAVAPNTPILVNVKVSGVDFDENETRSANIELRIGSQTLYKSVRLEDIKRLGTFVVPFNVTIPSDDAGNIAAIATVNIDKKLIESTTTDNSASKNLYVLCNVETSSKQMTFFSQAQAPWGTDDYDHQAPEKMKAFGCMVSALAMVFDFHGIKTAHDGTPMTPRSVNNGLNALNFIDQLGPQFADYNGYTPTGGVQSNSAVAFARQAYTNQCVFQTGNVDECFAQSLQKISYRGSANQFDAAVKKEIDHQLCKGNPVILKVPSMSRPNDLSKAHFVVAKAMTVEADGTIGYAVNNPGRIVRSDEFVPATGSKIRGFRMYVPTGDPSMIYVHLAGPQDMIITDPLGRKAGFNPFTATEYNEIPGGTYISSESISSPDDPMLSTPNETRFEGLEALDGEYRVEVFSQNLSRYQLTTYKFDATGTINGIDEQRGDITPGSTAIVKVQHKSSSIPVHRAKLVITKADFYDVGRNDRALIKGRVASSDGKAIPFNSKYLSISVGTLTKLIDTKKLLKLKLRGTIHYIYTDWGRRGITLELNSSTGEFILYLDNFTLDDSNPILQTNLKIQLDGLSAESLITFRNVRKRSK